MRRSAAAADVELLQQRARRFEDAAGTEKPAPRIRRLCVVVQHEVLGERELEHETAAMPVLRDVPDAFLEELVRRRVCDGASADDYRAFLRPAQSGQRVDQLRLAVAVDA